MLFRVTRGALQALIVCISTIGCGSFEDQTFMKPSRELQSHLQAYLENGDAAPVEAWLDTYHGEAPGHQMMVDFVAWGNRNPREMSIILAGLPSDKRGEIMRRIQFAASDTNQKVQFPIIEDIVHPAKTEGAAQQGAAPNASRR